jgi:hypothetical protein
MTIMKRLVSLLCAALLVSIFSVPALASVKAGSPCTKLNSSSSVAGYIYTCIKSGKKLVWGPGVKIQIYDAAFAEAHLSQAKDTAAQILANAKEMANQISSPPYCSTGNSRAYASIGSDPSTGLRALVFENPGKCELLVRASAVFFCDGAGRKMSNVVTSTGTFSLRAGQTQLVSYNISYYFPQVLNDCYLLTRVSSNLVNISSIHRAPSVSVLSSTYTGSFNQVEATKKANQYLKSEKARADKVIADAKNPTLIAKAWKAAAEAKIAADIQAVADAKAAAEAKVVAEAKAVADAKAAAEAKAVADAKAAAEAKAVADAKAAAEAKAASDLADRAKYDEGLGKVCVPGSKCEIGNTGPGGGIIFYDAGSQKSWGRYLEVAPNVWLGGADDPKVEWCNVYTNLADSVTDTAIRATLGVEIGKGKANTDLMLANCTSGAGVLSRSYKGGGKSDWYLPSKFELEALCKYARYQPTENSDVTCKAGGILRQGFSDGIGYWSSSEILNGGEGFYGVPSIKAFGSNDVEILDYRGGKNLAISVRPIRAF